MTILVFNLVNLDENLTLFLGLLPELVDLGLVVRLETRIRLVQFVVAGTN
jgi:hypothetical protein